MCIKLAVAQRRGASILFPLLILKSCPGLHPEASLQEH